MDADPASAAAAAVPDVRGLARVAVPSATEEAFKSPSRATWPAMSTDASAVEAAAVVALMGRPAPTAPCTPLALGTAPARLRAAARLPAPSPAAGAVPAIPALRRISAELLPAVEAAPANDLVTDMAPEASLAAAAEPVRPRAAATALVVAPAVEEAPARPRATTVSVAVAESAAGADPSRVTDPPDTAAGRISL